MAAASVRSLASAPLARCGSLIEQDRAGSEGEGNVLRSAGIALAGSVWGSGWAARRFSQIGAPGVEVIDPGLDGVEPVAEFVHGEGGGPEIVGEGASVAWNASLVRCRAGRANVAGDVVVAIGEDCSGDRDGIAEDSSCGIAAAVDLRLNFFDDDTFAAFDRFHITLMFLVNRAFPWYSGDAHFRYVSRRLG